MLLFLLFVILVTSIILWLMLSVRPRVREKKHQERLAILNRLKPEVENAFSEISSFYGFNH